ncbi:restriction endonuclease [Campylobacter sp. RM12654]|uniref:restriction endonuclease n=1 Tax=Campylobacter sp. RM12654 TaxID=2735738 RepID=UPI003014BBF3|nr:restriction endonuclease [Campylobacter sp. RM12654]
MSKIINAKGRVDGNSGYARVIGNEELGKLLSRVQSTVISNGSELERLLISRSQCIQNIDEFIKNATENKISNGTYLCLKKTFKKSTKYSKGVEKIEPDMMIFVVQEHRVCKIIELKDGDVFDTKKSAKEKENLEKFAMIFGVKIPFVTEYYICSFNQNDKEKIKLGFKGVFDLENIMTGKELCDILNINYDEIINIRKKDAKENLEYFIDELVKIKKIQQMLKDKI